MNFWDLGTMLALIYVALVTPVEASSLAVVVHAPQCFLKDPCSCALSAGPTNHNMGSVLLQRPCAPYLPAEEAMLAS